MANFLHDKLPDSVYINGDIYMFEWMKNNLDKFKEIFGLPPELDDLKECFKHNIHTMKPEQFQKFLSVVASWVEARIENAIAFQTTQNVKFIIIEWAGIHEFDIWGKADCCVVINAQYEKLRENLKNRLIKDGRYSENHLNARTEIAKGLYKIKGRVDYIINNDYDEHFEVNAQQLVNELIN